MELSRPVSKSALKTDMAEAAKIAVAAVVVGGTLFAVATATGMYYIMVGAAFCAVIVVLSIIDIISDMLAIRSLPQMA